MYSIQFKRPYHGHLDHEHSYLLCITYFKKTFTRTYKRSKTLCFFLHLLLANSRLKAGNLERFFTITKEHFFFRPNHPHRLQSMMSDQKQSWIFQVNYLCIIHTYAHIHSFTFAVQLRFHTCNFFFKYYRKRLDNLPHKYIK